MIKAKKEGVDSASDPWISIANPDDLFPHLDEDDEFDIKDFNDGLHGMQILPGMPDYVPLSSWLEISSDSESE